MRFLKKFNTEEEYEAYLNSEDFVRPCVARIVDDKAVRYKKRYKNGVYVQHVDGKLFTTEQWTEKGFSGSDANGVALITSNVQYVIAKTDASAGYTLWSSSTSKVDGATVAYSFDKAKNDFAGEVNTAIIANEVSGAATLCIDYIVPNGQSGYLPALGELREACEHKTDVESAMSLIDGESFAAMWSSTQKAGTDAWVIHWSNNVSSAYSKNSTNGVVRAFAPLNY